MHSKITVSGVFTLCFLFTKCILCAVSHQQRNNISGLAARYKIYGVKAQEEIIIQLFCSSKYKIHVAVAFGGNAA